MSIFVLTWSIYVPNFKKFRRSAAEIWGGGAESAPPPRRWDGSKESGLFRVKGIDFKFGSEVYCGIFHVMELLKVTCQGQRSFKGSISLLQAYNTNMCNYNGIQKKLQSKNWKLTSGIISTVMLMFWIELLTLSLLCSLPAAVP